MVPKMNEMFALCRAKYVTLCCRGLSSSQVLPQCLADAKAAHAEQEGPAFLIDCVNDNLLRHRSQLFVMGAYHRKSALSG